MSNIIFEYRHGLVQQKLDDLLKSNVLKNSIINREKLANYVYSVLLYLHDYSPNYSYSFISLLDLSSTFNIRASGDEIVQILDSVCEYLELA